MADLKDWSTNDSDNGGLAAPDGPNSGWTGSQVGPWARRTMASVAEWYKDPAWVNPMENIADLGDKTVVRVDANTVRVASNTGGSIATSATDYFPVGRMIRLAVSGGSTKIHGFVYTATVSGSPASLTLSLGLLGQSEIASGTTFVNNGIEVYGGQSAETTANDLQALGAVAFSGTGTEAERDALYPMALGYYPDGLLWFNSTTELMQVKRGAFWGDFATYDDALDDSGRVFRVEANSNSTGTGVTLSLISKHTGFSTVRGYEKDPNGGSNHERGVIYFDDAGDGIIVEGSRRDANNTNGTFGRLIAYGAGASSIGGQDRRGKLWYSRHSWNEGGTATILEQSSSLTPGPGNGLDADTVDGSHASALMNVLSILDQSGGSYANGEGGSFRLFDGTTTLLVQWPADSNWVQSGTLSSGYQQTWTFGTAYASAPIVLGSQLYTYNTGNSTVYTGDPIQNYAVSATSLIYQSERRTGFSNNYSYGYRFRTGVPIVIGIAAS